MSGYNTFVGSSIEDEVELNELEKLFYRQSEWLHLGSYYDVAQQSLAEGFEKIKEDIEKDLFYDKE